MSICGIRKAVVLLFLSKAELIEIRPNRTLNTAKYSYPFPSVIKLDQYVRLPYKKVELSRKNILRRDNFRCMYCNKANLPLTIDHVIPKSRRGESTWENLVCACVSCNNKKGNRTPEEANMRLRTKPIRPNYVSFLRNVVGNVEKEWEPYLFM